VRVIGEEGKQLGVMTTADALAKAKEAGVDLVEIAPKANPPVAKIIEFGKFKYQEEKKLQKQKKGAKSGELKEIRLSPFIADADFDNRMERIKEFLDERNKVRVVVKFMGRQMGSKEFGYKVLQKVLTVLGDRVVIDMEPKFIGRHLSMVISPTNKSANVKNANDKLEEENAEQEI